MSLLTFGKDYVIRTFEIQLPYWESPSNLSNDRAHVASFTVVIISQIGKNLS